MKELISDSMSTHFNGETSSFRSPLELAKKLFNLFQSSDDLDQV